MFYRTDQKHGLPHNPFNSIVAPRPIGWISTLDRDGRPNLAPYSFFNAVSYAPPQVIFSGGPRPARRGEDVPMKDSVINARETGEFVVNIATWETRQGMNASSAGVAADVDEFDFAGLAKEKAELVRPPRVKEAPFGMRDGRGLSDALGAGLRAEHDRAGEGRRHPHRRARAHGRHRRPEETAAHRPARRA
jgi:flavin reductase (DIM6/NTAB) family NADH-FMN oxidoreductase RutF